MGDKTRTHSEVCRVFNEKYSDRYISQSAVSGIEQKFLEFGTVKYLSKHQIVLDKTLKIEIVYNKLKTQNLGRRKQNPKKKETNFHYFSMF